MRFPVFTHNSNPAIDSPLIRKSYAYCAEMVACGNASWLPAGKGIHMFPPEGERTQDVIDDSLASYSSQPTITANESKKNAEYDKRSRDNHPAVIAAWRKFRVWPSVGDTKAVRVGIRVGRRRSA